MIDPENLRTASLYINNQLLSRGLLRDGQNIDFADPEDGDGGLQATMGRIMSVVNDLILRRDRDAEHRESLSSTMRTLRADYQRQTTEFARQAERLGDTQRRLDSAEATERSLRTQLKAAEQGIHKLKEEAAKMKSLVAQTRSACANEVRKRDRQIDSLKKAVTDAGRVRGGGKSRDIITITVTGEYDGEGAVTGMPAGATESEGYSLRMETNGFLTELAKGLSEENEGLLALVRRTADGLREMSGLDRHTGIGHEHGLSPNAHDELVTQPPQKSAEELATELEAIVEHLRSILTNPSFVPIEEVEVRDEAIGRLRAGLETMEARWKDAVHMMDGWRRRMVSSGQSVDIEDLRMGLRLSPVRIRDVEETANLGPMRLSCVQEEDEDEDEDEDVHPQNQNQDDEPRPRRMRSQSPVESLRLVPAPGHDVEGPGHDSDSGSSIFQDDIDIDDLDVEEPNVQILQISTADSIDSSPLPEPPQISPLKDSYCLGNRGASRNPPHYKKPGDFATIVEENTSDLAAAVAEKPAPVSTPRVSKLVSPSQKSRGSSPRTDEDALPAYTASYDSPLFGKSGERPSQAQLNRKLFSKSPEKRTSNTGASTGSNPSQGDKGSPPQMRVTRSSARKSAGGSPTPNRAATQTAKRIALDLPVNPNPNANISVASPTIASRQKLATEIAQRNTVANPSPSTSSPDKKQPHGRSPVRVQLPPSGSSSSSTSSSSRLPRSQTQQAPLNMATIAAKLAASEREADAARVRAKLKAIRRSRRISGMGVEDAAPAAQGQTQAQAGARTPAESQTSADDQDRQADRTTRVATHTEQHAEDAEDVDPVKRDPIPSPLKRGPRRRWSRGAVGADDVDELALESNEGAMAAAIGTKQEEDDKGSEDGEADVGLKITKRRGVRRTNKVASRRRSTLSPWELQGLISGNVGNVESPAR